LDSGSDTGGDTGGDTLVGGSEAVASREAVWGA